MATKVNHHVEIEGRVVELTNLDKLLWPDANVTKADLIHYIFMMSHRLLPHLKDRPLTLTRFPDGVDEEGFYQKDCPDYAPEWIATYPVLSSHRDKEIRFILANDAATLVWLANQAAIEFHPWMSRVHTPDSPDYVVIDLDPSEGASFHDVKTVASFVHHMLSDWGLTSFPKLSGATGIHVYVPIQPPTTYKETSAFAGYIGELAVREMPSIATNERLVCNRSGRVYVDHLQNLPGKTIVSAYSPRPGPQALVSAPFDWKELPDVDPRQFSIKNLDQLLARPESFDRLYHVEQNIHSIKDQFAHRLTR